MYINIQKFEELTFFSISPAGPGNFLSYSSFSDLVGDGDGSIMVFNLCFEVLCGERTKKDCDFEV